ncbi:ribosome biogenesis protein NOP53-like [Convolutriloba macropyga]|uniref:ribosome biogenesis protein NOP53-like n=1 Tax=Convolutriloba macropyga TaxID=536237 RepID=UPI003F52496F
MGRKTGKSRKKYWKSNELAAKTNEITELSKSNLLRKEIAAKSDNELFALDKSKQWVSAEGSYSAASDAPPKSIIEKRSEIDDWTHRNEKYQKRPKFTAKDLDKSRESARVYSFDKDIWGSSKGLKRKTVSKPNANDHVSLPTGGLSYNPSYSDHQTHLSNVLEREEKEEKQKKAEQEFWNSIPPVTHEEKEAAYMEGVENFFFKQKLCDEGINDESKNANNVINVHPPLSNRKLKLTPKQRDQLKRKQYLKTKLNNAMKKEKLKNARENEALHAKTINKRLAKVEQLKLLKWQAKQTRKNNPKRVRIIGRTYPEELKASFKLTEELQGSLRKLVPEGDSLISERLESMIKRNIIEPMPLTRAKTTARQRYIEKRRQRKNVRNVYNQKGEIST